MIALPTTSLVVDASFLIALADQEPEASRFIPVLARSIVTSINMGEVLYKLDERASTPPRSRSAQTAAGIATPRSLSLADLTCLAYATEVGLAILTGDRHWSTLAPHGLTVATFDFRDLEVTL